MNNKSKIKNTKDHSGLRPEVSAKITRKLKARRNSKKGVWFGLGMMGLIGWSVAIPTLLGIALGIWLDNHYVGKISWTLTLLISGLFLGCLNAWYWLDKEDRAIKDEEENNSE